MKAIGYVRVSSEDQAREGVSLDAQEARLRAYATAKGWTLVDVVRDEGRSAKDLRRPGLERILTALPRRRARDFDAVVVVKLDRLTRSVRDLATLMEAFRRARVAFCSLEESVDTGSAAGELFLNVIGALSQWERRAIGERTRAAMLHLKRTGRRYSGVAPFGWGFGPGGRLIANDGEQDTLRRIVRLRARGLALRAIATRLAAEGVMARAGRPFAPSTLLRLVREGTLANSAAG